MSDFIRESGECISLFISLLLLTVVDVAALIYKMMVLSLLSAVAQNVQNCKL